MKKVNNATTNDIKKAKSMLESIEVAVRRLVREKEDLDQMRKDAKYAHKFRELIVRQNVD
jgi:hypothetical protein